MWLIVLVSALYVLAPGHPQVPLGGMPIGQTGIALLVLLAGAWWWGRPHARVPAMRVAALAALVAARLAVAWMAPDVGWAARYYANEEFAPPVERSIDFPRLDATRLDRDLSFENTEFPVHFFNDRHYNTGVFREWSEPFSIHWTGHVHLAEPSSWPLRLTARGRARVVVDGVEVARVESGDGAAGADAAVALTAGPHAIDVFYQKPPEAEGLLRVQRVDGGRAEPAWADGDVTPVPTSASARGRLAPLRAVAWVLHVLAFGLVFAALFPGVRARVADVRRLRRTSPVQWAHWLAGPVVVGLLLAQGLYKAQPRVGHVWTLSGGDDWLNYEMAARDVALNGLMMSEGGVIGRGQPFSLYPGYSYFVALVHTVTGESLAGVVLVNFLLLAAATLVTYLIVRRLLGPVAALGGLAWLLAIEQADFVRYYTVTLFSENLYFLLTALTVWWLVTFVEDGGWRPLVAAALAGSLASITRPSMMLMLPVAAVLIVAARARRDGLARTFAAAAAFGGVWMAALSPITLRNYWMSGRAVLITSGQAITFVVYNLPVNDPKYLKNFDGTLWTGAKTLAWIFIEHPLASLDTYGTKLGFSLGMVHWMGSGTPHPELVLTSVAYFAAFVFLPAMRSIAAMPMHAFVFTHVATLMLTMPSNYGYRMILPAFLFMSVVAGALAARALFGPAVRRWPALGRGVVEAAA